jgi:hypothetical protein
MKFRARSIGNLFTGTDGLTEKQEDTLNNLLSKIKLTEKQAETRDELIAKRDAPIELPQGAKSYVESLVEKEVYDYKDIISTKEMEKGTLVEDESIYLYNRVFFTDYQKSELSLQMDNVSGHPDISDESSEMIIDIKSSWSKKTFPKLPEQAKNTLYEWQVKTYLMMKGWTKGQIAYCLVNTPESLLNDWDDDTLHYVEHLDDRMRVTIVDVELTEADKRFMKGRINAAAKYYDEYKLKLESK